MNARSAVAGLSPRVRGNRPGAIRAIRRQRSIPACAGEPYVSVNRGYNRAGLSPRVRGNPTPGRWGLRRSGSIPACAGEPEEIAEPVALRRVYPRVCGGTSNNASRRCLTVGLSPRVRGNHKGNYLIRHLRRSIPACAGEPGVLSQPGDGVGVYPRVCGGTIRILGSGAWETGLSPRVRGNHGHGREPRKPPGSIPACAGEPLRQAPATSTTTVYPRVCGGTRVSSGLNNVSGGLSPRVRGNLSRGTVMSRGTGSIPACAGEPPTSPATVATPEVYPRVCGGTSSSGTPACTNVGLSPRVRGNPKSGHHSGCSARSIPACAGEPRWPGAATRGPSVYPRVCGGTGCAFEHVYTSLGLSPRVRGNRPSALAEQLTLRSIPACAGEPLRT